MNYTYNTSAVFDSIEFRFTSEALCQLLGSKSNPPCIIFSDTLQASDGNSYTYKIEYIGSLPKYRFYGKIIVDGLPLCNIYSFSPFDRSDTNRIWIDFQGTNYSLYNNYFFTINFLDYLMKKHNATDFVFRKIDVAIDAPDVYDYALYLKNEIAGNKNARRLLKNSKIDLTLFFPENNFTGLLSCKKGRSTACQMSLYNKTLDIKNTGKLYIDEYHKNVCGFDGTKDIWRCEYRFSSYFFDTKKIRYISDACNFTDFNFSFDLLYDPDFFLQTLLKYGNYYHSYYITNDSIETLKQNKQSIADHVDLINLFSFLPLYDYDSLVCGVQAKPVHKESIATYVDKSYIKSTLRGLFSHVFYTLVLNGLTVKHDVNNYTDHYLHYIKTHLAFDHIINYSKVIDFDIIRYLQKRIPVWFEKHLNYYLKNTPLPVSFDLSVSFDHTILSDTPF